MATPPIHQSSDITTTTAGSQSRPPSVIYRVYYILVNISSQRRPWSVFFDCSSLSRPSTCSEAYSRICNSFFYFRANHLSLYVSGVLILLLVYDSDFLVNFMANWGIICLFLPSYIRHSSFFFISSLDFETVLVFICFCGYIQRVEYILISAYGVVFAVMLVHGAFQVVPTVDELSLDRRVWLSNLIPTKHVFLLQPFPTSLISGLKSFIRSDLSKSKSRPLSELIDRNSFSRPYTISEAHSRFLNNLYYFRINYAFIFLLVTPILFLVFDPYSLFTFLLVWAILSLFFPYFLSLLFFGCNFPYCETFFALAYFFVFLSKLLTNSLGLGYVVGLVIVLAHSVFRVPEDLFYDCPQEPSDYGIDTIKLIQMSDNSSSSSSSPKKQHKHDVFLSFRGADTRNNFTSHLYAELCCKNIDTFIDDRLGRGQNISPSLHKAIEESMIHVVIFSQNYASSTWCLDELTKILECKERYGSDVIPVFYKVHPSTVRHQRGNYAVAFAKHQRLHYDKVKGWKNALTQACGLSGWDANKIRSLIN